MFNKYLLCNKASSVFLVKGLSKLNSVYLLTSCKVFQNYSLFIRHWFCLKRRWCFEVLWLEEGLWTWVQTWKTIHSRPNDCSESQSQPGCLVVLGTVTCRTHGHTWSPIVKDGFNETRGVLHQKSPLMNRIGKKFTFMIFIHKMKLFTHSVYQCFHPSRMTVEKKSNWTFISIKKGTLKLWFAMKFLVE